MTKRYSVPLLIGESTWEAVADQSRYSVRLIDRVQPFGRDAQLQLIEVLDVAGKDERAAKEATAKDYAEGLEHWRLGRFDQAEKCFQRCVDACADDGPAALFVERCRLRSEGDSLDDWTGVVRLPGARGRVRLPRHRHPWRM